MLSIYDSNSSIDDRIYYLKYYETYDGTPINEKLHQILVEYKSNYSEIMEKIIDAILYTRNIHSGRGLRDLTYSYLFTLQQIIPMKTVFVIYMIVNEKIGSWRDVRTYCEYVAKHSEKGRKDMFINPIICIYNHQLLKDNEAWKNAEEGADARKVISYASKWVPRETKGRKWMFNILVDLYNDPEYNAIRSTAQNPEQKKMAFNKCKMMYRKMVSNLNKALDTVEIKECANEWDKIDPEKLSTTQLFNNKNAFETHGAQFSDKYKENLELITKKKYSYNVPVWKLVKHILRLEREKKTEEINIMNLHWLSYVEKNINVEPNYYFVMIDMSMEEKQLYNAIGMACAIASKSLFGFNVLAVGPNSEWVDLSDCDFSTMINRIMRCKTGLPVSIIDAFGIVLDAVKFAKMEPADVDNLKIQFYTNSNVEVSNISQMWKSSGFVLDSHNLVIHKG